MIEYITAGGVIIVVAGWFLMHTRNHIVKRDVVEEFNRLRGPDGMQWKETCNERTKRIEEAIDNVEKKLDMEFKNLKELIRNKA